MVNHLDLHTTLSTRSLRLVLAEGTDNVELHCLGGIIVHQPHFFSDSGVSGEARNVLPLSWLPREILLSALGVCPQVLSFWFRILVLTIAVWVIGLPGLGNFTKLFMKTWYSVVSAWMANA